MTRLNVAGALFAVAVAIPAGAQTRVGVSAIEAIGGPVGDMGGLPKLTQRSFSDAGPCHSAEWPPVTRRL